MGRPATSRDDGDALLSALRRVVHAERVVVAEWVDPVVGRNNRSVDEFAPRERGLLVLGARASGPVLELGARVGFYVGDRIAGFFGRELLVLIPPRQSLSVALFDPLGSFMRPVGTGVCRVIPGRFTLLGWVVE